MNNFLQALPAEIRNEIKENYSLAELTTFKIGGPADMYFEPKSIEEVRTVYKLAFKHEINVTIIGNGSNLVIADSGIRGLVIALRENLAAIDLIGLKELPINHAQCKHLKRIAEVYPHTPIYCDFGADPIFLRAEAGAKLIDVAAKARELGLTGLEFACGIPGSVGGAVYMNAGAYGNSIEDTVIMTLSVDFMGDLHWTMGDEHDFSYRHSIFSDYGQVVLETYFVLRPGLAYEVDAYCEDYTRRRNSTQPLDLPSAGSMFKRPHGYFAGKLISDAGLKGYGVGGAAVSQKHAGFIVNVDHAKAVDVRNLVKDIQLIVFKQFGVKLETEVRFIGDWDN